MRQICNDHRLPDAGNELELPAVARTGLDLHAQHTLQSLCPAHRHASRSDELVGAQSAGIVAVRIAVGDGMRPLVDQITDWAYSWSNLDTTGLPAIFKAAHFVMCYRHA